MNLPLPVYDVESHRWYSARCPSKGHQLFALGPIETLIEAPLPNPRQIVEELPESHHDQQLREHVTKAVPEASAALDLVAELAFESSILQNDIEEFDPLQFSLLSTDVVDYSSDYYSDPRRSVAFPGGDMGTTLMLSRVMAGRYIWDDERDMYVSGPHIEEPEAIYEFSSQIRSIKGNLQEPVDSARGHYIGVRTYESVFVFNANIRDSFGISAPRMMLTSEDIGGKTIADFALNPWDRRQLTVIDVQGRWSAWDKQHKKGLTGSRYSTGRISGEKRLPGRVTYGQDPNSLLVNNCNVFELVDMRSGGRAVSLFDVTAERFPSKIYDVRRWGNSSTSAFLLTSKEIMWIDGRMPGRAVMSVKHRRDPTDNSLAVQLCALEEGMTALIHSQKTNYVTGYSFGRGEVEIPVYLDNAFELPDDHEGQSLAIGALPAKLMQRHRHKIKLEREQSYAETVADSPSHFLSIVKLRKGLSVTTQMFSTNNTLGQVTKRKNRNQSLRSKTYIGSSDEEEEEENDSDASLDSINRGKRRYGKHDQLLNLKEIYEKSYLIDDRELLTNNSPDALESYVSDLKAALTAENSTHQTLAELSLPSQLFDDVSKLPDTLEELGLRQLPLPLPNTPQEIYETLMAAFFHNLDPACPPQIRIRRERLCRLLATQYYLSHNTPSIATPTGETALSRLAKYSKTTPINNDPSHEIGSDERTNRILNDWKVGEKVEDYEWREEAPISARLETLSLKKRRESRRQSRMLSQQISSQVPQTPSLARFASTHAEMTPRGNLFGEGPSQSQASQGDDEGSQPMIMSQITPGRFGSRKDKKKRRRTGF